MGLGPTTQARERDYQLGVRIVSWYSSAMVSSE